MAGLFGRSFEESSLQLPERYGSSPSDLKALKVIRAGKSDPIDAELAARAALSQTATAVPKQTSGIVEAIRQLQVVRTSALNARHAALQQLNDLIVTASERLRSELRRGRTMRAKATLCRKLRPTRSAPTSRHKPQSSGSATSPAASTNSTVRSTTSTASSSSS
jgi:transposase